MCSREGKKNKRIENNQRQPEKDFLIRKGGGQCVLDSQEKITWYYWNDYFDIQIIISDKTSFLAKKKGHEVQIFNSTWVPERHMGLGKAGTATDWHCHTDHQETISGSATKALFNHSDRAVTFLELQRHLSNWHKSNIQDQNVSLRNFWGLITHDILIWQPK